VGDFGGTKTIVISTESWLGDKNSFVGEAYIALGAFSWVVAIIFLFKYRKSPRKFGEFQEDLFDYD